MPQGLLSVHAAILLFGLSGLFGKFLALHPVVIVQGRTVFACMVLLPVLWKLRVSLLPRDRGHWFWLVITGLTLAVHWVSFFEAIQVSTVAVGLLSFSSYPLFTTFLEPLIFRERLLPRNVAAAFVVISGLALIATSGTGGVSGLSPGSVLHGVGWGLFSGFTFAVLTLLNRLHVRRLSPLTVGCWQNAFAALALVPFSMARNWDLTPTDWGLLIILGVVCTAGGHVLLINGLRIVRAQLASLLIAGLEPVYAIVFALLLLQEIPGSQTIAGGMLIVGTSAWMCRKPVSD